MGKYINPFIVSGVKLYVENGHTRGMSLRY